MQLIISNSLMLVFIIMIFFWKNINGRLSASYNIPLTSLNNFIKAILDKENSTILYNANKATTNIVINVIFSAYYGQTVIFKAILSDQAGDLLGGKTVKLNIGGLILNLKTNSKGEASYSYLANKFIGSKNIIADFIGDSLYNGVSKNINLNVVKAKTSLIISNFKALYKKSNVIKAIIKGQNGKILAGKVVNLYINGKYIAKAKSSSSGLVSFKYTFKTGKTHKVIANFAGDSYYLAKNSPTLKVIPKSKTYTKLSKFAAKYGKITTFKATLKNTANKAMVKKYIKFYANGKYLGQAKTNSNGLAILSKKISFKGLVSFIAKYLGDSKNHESSYTQKLTIK
ncbi:Ig-like domain-containing protein [Methanobrevibacter arboriphilus]|uniref:Ig-like domain-containing protein n=1 Tax=Methanobrevibacter arboriphilus TaxID=39441 RepID=UPI001CDAC75C|nr:Ig-like domain-containing protein [Methanobrevibacter arboriphilus]